MRSFAWGVALFLLLVLGAGVSAQEAGADCRVWKPHVENPIDYTHYYTQPAILWDVEGAALSVGIYEVLRQFHVPPIAAALVPTIGIGLAPHLVGYTQGRYGVSMHWAFRFANSSLPLALVSPNRKRAVTTWLVSTAALVCYDR
jgi:hypothetical protein